MTRRSPVRVPVAAPALAAAGSVPAGVAVLARARAESAVGRASASAVVGGVAVPGSGWAAEAWAARRVRARAAVGSAVAPGSAAAEAAWRAAVRGPAGSVAARE